MKTISTLLAIGILHVSLVCSAWGVRGHLSVCEAAAKLVKHQELAEYFGAKSSRIGYLCDIPDLQWRFMSQNFKEHLLRPENLNMSLEQLPLDYSKIMQQYPGQAKLLGSNWWRAEQFYKRAVSLKPDFQTTGDSANHAATEFLTYLGIMGHFIGDISQPFHSTADYNGFGIGHGGIHLYYEEEVVDFISGSLPEKIVSVARQASTTDAAEYSFLAEKSILKKARTLALLSRNDKASILSLDPILTPSSQDKRGLNFPAKRKAPSFGAGVYEAVILKEMAHAALLLAQIWDQAYEEVGSPDFSKMKPDALPVVFTYIPPDYF